MNSSRMSRAGLAISARSQWCRIQLSRIETGKSPCTQDFLELAAEAYMTDVPSLLMRDPRDPEAIWSIWDHAEPNERQMIVDVAKTVTKRAS
jgi:hypothetical protein